jgi:hypothetical protein
MTFAQIVGSGSTGIVGAINTIVVPIIFALAFAFFIWGVLKYVFIDGLDPKKQATARSFIIWGILGMVVLFSVWGFVNIALSTFGISPNS